MRLKIAVSAVQIRLRAPFITPEIHKVSHEDHLMTAAVVRSVRLTVNVNGAAMDVGAATLAELLVEAGYAGRVATAVNGDFVPERARIETKLRPGDRIEILTPRQGG
jgi:sulfur carrier protein